MLIAEDLVPVEHVGRERVDGVEGEVGGRETEGEGGRGKEREGEGERGEERSGRWRERSAQENGERVKVRQNNTTYTRACT